MAVNNLDIPPNATIRQEYVKCGNKDTVEWLQKNGFPSLSVEKVRERSIDR
jgi:hypothetical protein